MLEKPVVHTPQIPTADPVEMFGWFYKLLLWKWLKRPNNLLSADLTPYSAPSFCMWDPALNTSKAV